jgi:hypothetical protein
MPIILHNELHRSRSNGWQGFKVSAGGGGCRTLFRPDANGHFNRENVTAVCARKNCTVEFASEYVAFVRHAKGQHVLTAIDPDKWVPIAVLEARSNALQRPVFKVDYLQARPKNPNGLDELKIARVLAADGIKPYLSRSGHYGADERGVLVPGTRWDEDAEGVKRAGKDEPTWVLYQILSCNVLRQPTLV